MEGMADGGESQGDTKRGGVQVKMPTHWSARRKSGGHPRLGPDRIRRWNGTNITRLSKLPKV